LDWWAALVLSVLGLGLAVGLTSVFVDEYRMRKHRWQYDPWYHRWPKWPWDR